MKKSLVATAIATAIAAPVANAGVVLYGKIHASIDYIDVDGFGGVYYPNRDEGPEDWDPVDEKAWYVSSRASRIGFKGTEDLGNGLSLIWKAETTYNLDSGGWGGGRNAYIGLTGDWGTFLYGRHDTPMKISTGKLDLFGDQLGDYNWSMGPNNALLGPGFNDVRAPNAIAYISPNWNGFTFAGAIVPGEGTDCIDPSDEPKCNNGLADSYSVAAMYSNNGLYLAAAYENLASTERDDAGGTPWGTFAGFSPALSPISGDSNSDSIHEWDEPLKKWRIGIGYTINAFTLGAVYENQDSSGLDSERHDRTNYEADIWQISGAYDFGNNRLKVAYGENKADLIQTDCDTCDKFHGAKSKHFAIGLDHKLSKRTTAYLVYAQADINDIFEEDSTDSGDDRLYQGGEESGFSMGLIHNF